MFTKPNFYWCVKNLLSFQLINIKSRYKNSIKAIHITLNKYKQNLSFQNEVKRYRSEGWLDWQILQALYNTILDIKAKAIVANNGKKYPNDNDEIWLKDFQETFKGLVHSDESNNYIEIALNLILGKNLDFQIQQVPFHVLESLSLEKKGGYPNSIAIRELLNQKFNFSEDEIIELSPFRDIE